MFIELFPWAYIIYIARPKIERERKRRKRKAQTTFRLRNDMFEPSFIVRPMEFPPCNVINVVDGPIESEGTDDTF